MYNKAGDILSEELRELSRMAKLAADGKIVRTPIPVPRSPELAELYRQVSRLIATNQSQFRLRASQKAFFQRVFDELPVEVVIFDNELKYRYINPVAVKDDGMREWMIGKTDKEYCEFRQHSEEFTEQRQQLYERTVATGHMDAIFQSAHDQEGRMRHYYRQLTPVYYDNGELEMLIGYGLEITEIKLKEDELASQNARLEKTSSELDQFVYRVSHDLRSPVVSIQGLVSLAELEEVPPTILRYLDLIRSKAFKMDAVIHDIVSFSQNSRREVEFIEVNPQEVVQKTIEELPENLRDTDIRIIQEIEGQYAWFTDPFRTHLLLKNLLTNALKFQRPEALDHGFVRLHVNVQPDEVFIVVEDNGIGIAPEQQEHIFDLFFRGNHGDGSGIGLYVVREVLERIGGKIELESIEGKGSRFIIALPNPQPELV